MVHGCMMYTEPAEMAGVSCGTSHASTVSTPPRWILNKRAIKKLFTHVESHAGAVSLLEIGEQRCIKAINYSPMTLGWKAEGPRFESASAVLSVQRLWYVDAVL